MTRDKYFLFSVFSTLALLQVGCAARKVNQENGSPEQMDKDQKIESLTSALSRAQSRIEELDARVSSLSDKLESTRLTVDNISGPKNITTKPVGSLENEDAENSDSKTSSSKKATQGAVASSSHEGKALLNMDGAIQEFTKASALYKSGKYSDAVLAMNHFTEQYPEHALAGSAQYLAGESYFAMGEYKLAINEYGKVISSFNSSPRVVSAMVRLSHCHEMLGSPAEAAKILTSAQKLYPGHPELDLSRPIKEKKLLAQPIEPKNTEVEVAHSKPVEASKHDPVKEDSQLDDVDEKKNEETHH